MSELNLFCGSSCPYLGLRKTGERPCAFYVISFSFHWEKFAETTFIFVHEMLYTRYLKEERKEENEYVSFFPQLKSFVQMYHYSVLVTNTCILWVILKGGLHR